MNVAKNGQIVLHGIVLAAQQREGPLAQTEGGIEPLVRREPRGVRQNPFHLHVRFPGRLLRLGQHPGRDVHPRDPIPAPGQLHRVAPGPAAHVQDPAARRGAQLLENEIHFFQRVLGKGVVHVHRRVAVEELLPLVSSRHLSSLLHSMNIQEDGRVIPPPLQPGMLLAQGICEWFMSSLLSSGDFGRLGFEGSEGLEFGVASIFPAATSRSRSGIIESLPRIVALLEAFCYAHDNALRSAIMGYLLPNELDGILFKSWILGDQDSTFDICLGN